MKIKLLTSRSGVHGAHSRGDMIHVDIAEGERMIAAGQAELVRSVKKETAVKTRSKAEKAVK